MTKINRIRKDELLEIGENINAYVDEEMTKDEIIDEIESTFDDIDSWTADLELPDQTDQASNFFTEEQFEEFKTSIPDRLMKMLEDGITDDFADTLQEQFDFWVAKLAEVHQSRSETDSTSSDKKDTLDLLTNDEIRAEWSQIFMTTVDGNRSHLIFTDRFGRLWSIWKSNEGVGIWTAEHLSGHDETSFNFESRIRKQVIWSVAVNIAILAKEEATK